RSVCFTHQEASVFEGSPMVAGPAALLFGNVDNDPQGGLELAVGGVDGTLVVFKAPETTAFFRATGLGTVTSLAFGPLFLKGSTDHASNQLVACAAEGMCHIFNLR
ncbi:unnamed protein product, partial [Discosporangium mesarthrocarpum]